MKEKEFEISQEKIKGLWKESQKRKLVLVNKKGEVILSLALLWAVLLSIIFWPLIVVAVVLVLATEGSVRIEK